MRDYAGMWSWGGLLTRRCGSFTELAGGDRLMRVRVLETGEELDYRLCEILDDPRER